MDHEVAKATYRNEFTKQKFELFNVKNDPSEREDLYDKYPDVVKELKAELTKVFDNGRSTEGESRQNSAPLVEKFDFSGVDGISDDMKKLSEHNPEQWFQINWKD